MYNFPEEMRNSYESSPLSFVYYQKIDDQAYPVLASDGFCKNVGMEGVPREKVLRWLKTGLYDRMHQDDIGFMARISDDFLHQRGPYDVAFRCRIGEEYVWIHGLGKWQRMPDGTELAVIGYTNLSEFRERIVSTIREYDILSRDKFYTDPLTSLPNINFLHEFARERVKVLYSEGKKPSVIYSDIYSMVSYNNHYGFREGDELLRLVACELREQFPDDLLVRGANDHFILIVGTDSREVLSEKLKEANSAIRRKAKGNTLGIRSGICALDGEEDIAEAMDRARKVMRAIDDDMNRSYAFYSQAYDDQYRKNRYIIENLDRALEKGWIRIYYQRIIRTESGKLAAMEALARWVDPVRGTISPGDFIPVLRRYHQLHRLDLHMMEQVCREVKIRQENGFPLVPVSVNFSRQDFDHADVAEAIEEIYVRMGMEEYIPRNYFILEITEQDIAKGAEDFHSQLKKIREKGYQLWLDDFGSGYSALNVFSDYEFDLIKFDMDLLRHLDDHDGMNRLILKEMVRLSRKLGLHTLVEGLENEGQLAFIREIGCELVQGFYYDRPEPFEEILYRVRNGHRLTSCESAEERAVFARKLKKKQD